MIGSLTFALYFASRLVCDVMGQLVTKLAPGWLAPRDGPGSGSGADGVDECGGRLQRPAGAARRIVLRENEEVVIGEDVVVRAVSGALLQRGRAPLQLAGVPAAVSVSARGAAAKRALEEAQDRWQDGGDSSSEGEKEPEPKRKPPLELQTMIKSKDGYPFLDDDETVDYLATSKVMFVMKGLPGSGKSYLARQIQERYPDAIICSADDFFMKDGGYQFDRERLGEAHEACQRRAELACHQHRLHLIVDNTNVRDWEWRPYSRLAAHHHYLLLLVEPQTAWRHDPARLAQMNRHDVSERELSKKLKALSISIPLYYGWILNAADCQALLDRTKVMLEKAFRSHRKFADDFCMITGSSSMSELSALYQPPAELLHCTARFCGRGRAAGARQYAERSDVRRAAGRRFVTRVTGLLLTPRTLGARLTLDDAQLALWAQDDRRPTPAPPAGPGRGRRPGAAGWQADGVQPSLAVSGGKRTPRTGAGRRAHITLGCRPGQSAVVAGNDLMAALDVMEARPDILSRPAARLPGVSLHRVEQQVWYLDLERDIVVDTVFGARF